MIKKNYIEIAFLLSLGVLSSLSLPPYNYLIINFFTFSFFFIFVYKKSKIIHSKITFFFYGWLFGFGYFFSNLYWISISLTFDQNFKFLIPLTVFLIPALLAIFYGLISFFFLVFKPKKIISSFLVFSLIFGIVEFLRGSILTGFPWNLIAYSFFGYLEILSVTSIIGTYGFNLFCISLFTCPAIFFLRKNKKEIFVYIFFLFCVFSFYIYGNLYAKKFNTSDLETFDYNLRVIGSNISIDRFISDVNPILVIEELIKLSDPNKNEKTIFVWPEGIFPEISLLENPKVKYVGKEKIDNTEAHVIEMNGDVISIRFLYDINSGLKIREISTTNMGGQSQVQETIIGNYSEFNGILFPSEKSQLLGPQTIDMKLVDVLINPKLSDEDFN